MPPAALEIPAHGWVNLHFSLLPAWRGAAPVQHAVLHGDEVTGASVFELEAGMDTGPVFGTLIEPVHPTDTAGDLLARLATAGARLLVDVLDGIAAGSLVAVPQPADGVSLAPKITVEDALNARIISWPFGLYDCAAQSDGAAACVLTRADLAKSFRDDPVFVKAVSIAVAEHPQRERQQPHRRLLAGGEQVGGNAGDIERRRHRAVGERGGRKSREDIAPGVAPAILDIAREGIV